MKKSRQVILSIIVSVILVLPGFLLWGAYELLNAMGWLSDWLTRFDQNHARYAMGVGAALLTAFLIADLRLLHKVSHHKSSFRDYQRKGYFKVIKVACAVTLTCTLITGTLALVLPFKGLALLFGCTTIQLFLLTTTLHNLMLKN